MSTEGRRRRELAPCETLPEAARTTVRVQASGSGETGHGSPHEGGLTWAQLVSRATSRMAPLRQMYLTAPEWEAVGGQPLVAGVGVPVSPRAPPAAPVATGWKRSRPFSSQALLSGAFQARAAHEGGKNCPMPATVARARALLSKGETWRARADLLGQWQHPSNPGFPWPPPRRLHPENARTGGRPAARRGSRFCSPNPRALCLWVPWTTAACRFLGARGVWNIPAGRLSFLLSGAPSTLAPPRRRSARGIVGPAELAVSRLTPGLGGMTGPPGQPPGHTLPRAGPRLQPDPEATSGHPPPSACAPCTVSPAWAPIGTCGLTALAPAPLLGPSASGTSLPAPSPGFSSVASAPRRIWSPHRKPRIPPRRPLPAASGQ